MSIISMLNFVDYIVLVVLIVSAILSTLRGMTREFLGLAGWFIAIFLAKIIAPNLEPVIAEYLNVDVLVPILAWTIPFVSTVVIWFIIASLISPGLKKAGLGALDKWFGAFFGVVRGVLFVVAAYLGGAVIVNGEQNLPTVLTQSVSGDVSRSILSLSKPIIPSNVQDILEQVESVDIEIGDLAPDAPELVERRKDNVETGTTNITNQLDLLADEVNE